MSYFAAVLRRSAGPWTADEVSLIDCESIDEIADVVRDFGDETRLLVVEEDDEYAVLYRADGDDEPRIFLTDGHAADSYPLAALVADELFEIRLRPDDDLDDVEGAALEGELDAELETVAPPVHESAPFGDPSVVEDLGTSADELLAMCAHEGTLPIDVIVAVCERAGCADAFEAVRA